MVQHDPDHRQEQKVEVLRGVEAVDAEDEPHHQADQQRLKKNFRHPRHGDREARAHKRQREQAKRRLHENADQIADPESLGGIDRDALR